MTSGLEASSTIAHHLYKFYQAGSHLIAENFELSSYVGEAAFYNRVKAAPERVGSLTYLANRFATNHFPTFQRVFICANTLLTINTARKIIDLSGNDSMMHVANQTEMGSFLPASVLAVTMVISSSFVLSHLMQNPEKTRIIKSKTQILSAAIQMTSVINSLALAAVSQNKLSLLLISSLSSYSFVKNKGVNWLNYFQSRVLPLTVERARLLTSLNKPLIKQIDISYSALLLPKTPDDRDCPICWDPKPTQIFCNNGHAFHDKCLGDYIDNKAEFFYDGNKYTKKITRIYRNGVYDGNSYSYKVKVPEKNFPNCPICFEHPTQHPLDITIHDQKTGIHNASVTRGSNNQSDQKVFEKVNAIYNSFQAYLTFHQQIPEFAPFVTTLRSYLVITDILSGVMTNYHLKKNLEKRNRHWLYSVVPAALATIPIYLIARSAFTPTTALYHLTSYGVNASWERPLFQELHQVANIYRLLTTAGLTYFSKAHKGFNVTSLVTQGLGLYGGLSLPWLRVDQSNLDVPYHELSRANVATHSLVSWETVRNSDLLKTSIKKIAALQRKIISRSSWSMLTKIDGFFTSKSAVLSFEFPKVEDIRNYITGPFPYSFGGSVIHRTFGLLSLSIQGHWWQSFGFYNERWPSIINFKW